MEEASQGTVPRPDDGVINDAGSQTNNETEVLETRLAKLAAGIARNENDSLRKRWEFGHVLIDLRNGRKTLRRGDLQKYADREKVHRSEISARMKLAEKFPTEEKLSTAVETYRSWTAIRKALTDRKRKVADNSGDDVTAAPDEVATPSGERYTNRLRRIRDGLEAIEAADLNHDDLVLLAEIAKLAVDRHRNASRKLAQPKAA